MGKSFTSAIFFDMENLLKGYGLDAQALGRLSLKEIVQAIKEREGVADLAVQRAYAHWYNNNLGVMRREIMELGIEPIQIFGFSYEARKDAADLQLAIDAVDLAYTRPSISTYIIVSGDGGFAALAKKLHELGKTVIGAAYEGQTSHTLRAVCDDFVFLRDPEDSGHGADMHSSPFHSKVSAGNVQPVTLYDQAHIKRFIETLGREDGKDKGNALTMVQKVLKGIKEDAPLKADVLDGGLELQLLDEILRQVLPDFAPVLFGFARLSQFLQFACAGTDFAVGKDGQSQNGKLMLILRDAVPAGYEVLGDLSERPLHTVENYQDILKTGKLYFRLPNRKTMRTIIQWVEGQASEGKPQSDWLTQLYAGVGETADGISMYDAKIGFLSLVMAGVFERTPPQRPLAEQLLSLKHTGENGWISRTLSDALRRKLESTIQSVNEDVFTQVAP